MFATLNLNAAKATNGPDEFGRLYNYAFYDIKTNEQGVLPGAIEYSKKDGFDWTVLHTNLEDFSATEATYKVSGRIEVPKNITTKKVYVTLGKAIKFWLEIYKGDNSIGRSSQKKGSYNKSILKLVTSINDKAVLGANDILASTKSDKFGNRYVNFEILLSISLLSDKGYLAKVQKGIDSYVSVYNETFESIKIQVAPKSRSYKSKFVDADIYVMDNE